PIHPPTQVDPLRGQRDAGAGPAPLLQRRSLGRPVWQLHDGIALPHQIKDVDVCPFREREPDPALPVVVGVVQDHDLILIELIEREMMARGEGPAGLAATADGKASMPATPSPGLGSQLFRRTLLRVLAVQVATLLLLSLLQAHYTR